MNPYYPDNFSRYITDHDYAGFLEEFKKIAEIDTNINPNSKP